MASQANDGDCGEVGVTPTKTRPKPIKAMWKRFAFHAMKSSKPRSADHVPVGINYSLFLISALTDKYMHVSHWPAY